MNNSPSKPEGFFTELRRRRVLPIAGAYIAIAWLVTEIAGYVLEQTGAPAWSLRLLAIVFMVGFPISVVLAWMIQVGPDGKRTLDPSTGQHRTVIGAIALGIVATAGLAWLILPRIEEAPVVPGYEPIPNSIAVLPLFDAGATPNVKTMSSRVYEALRSGLDQHGELQQVLLPVDEKPADPAAFGRQYRVKTLLMGSIVSGSSGYQVDMKLLGVGSDKVLWSGVLDWDSTRIGEIGSEIATNVLEAMGLEALSEREFAGTDNRQAYDALISAHSIKSSLHADDQLLAMDEYERALALDPNYVRAHVGMAQAIWVYLWSSPPPEERALMMQRGQQALGKALELDPDSADAISIAALLEQDPELQIRAWRRALDLDPDHAITYSRLASRMWTDGDLVEAERLIRKAIDYKPMVSIFQSDLAGILWDQGRREEAMAAMQLAITLDPGMFQHYRLMSDWQYQAGDVDESLITLFTAYSHDPDRSWITAQLGLRYMELGDLEKAMAWIIHTIEQGRVHLANHVFAMWIFLEAGVTDAALQQAERVLQFHPVNPFALRVMGTLDIEAGQAQTAIERWETAYPQFKDLQSPINDYITAYAAVDFASHLLQAGKPELVENLLLNCMGALDGHPRYLQLAHALLGHRQETLDIMRDSIEGRREHIPALWYRLAGYDFLRDDPEFQALMKILNDRIFVQREHIKAMEHSGEIPPPPAAKANP